MLTLSLFIMAILLAISNSEIKQLRKEVDQLNICLSNHLDLGQQAPQPDPAITQRLQDKA